MYAVDWLGPFALRKGGAALPLSIRKAQALLVLLARDGAQPRERIVALLWPALDESTARRNLRRELARLRDAGAAELIHADGDRLALGAAVEVTARRFQAAVDEGEPESALALWRGVPADGLQLDDAEPWQDWLAHERRHLEALRAQALALSAAQHEAVGAWAPALERVRGLLAADPLQERHHVHAMRLLDRLGQREAALAQYEACVRVLADELGLQPMAATRELAAALRGAAAAPTAPAAPPAATRPSPPASGRDPPGRVHLPDQLPFAGREADVAWLEAGWARGAPLLIEGAAGIGKTRLARDVCAAHGAHAWVRCLPGDREVPYASFVRALRLLGGPDISALAATLPPWAAAELARVLPELGPAPAPLASAEERSRFFEACARAWSAVADGEFDALLLDDLHDADESSLALFTWLMQRGPGAAALRWLLLTRPGPQVPRLAALVGSSAAAHRVLEPLDAPAVLALLSRLSGVESPRRFAARIEQGTGGNPYFIAETLRHLAESGALQQDAQGRWHTALDESPQAYAELPLPASVRDAVLARVGHLGDAGRRVLEAASLTQEPFGPHLLAAACALSEIEASDALERALQAALVREHASGGYAFAHDLAHQALADALGAQRRRLVHRRLALAAEATQAGAALVAMHFEQAGDPRRAQPWRMAAGDEAAALFATDQALAHWQAALQLGGAAETQLDLLSRIARAHIERSDVDAAHAALARLLAAADQPGAAAPARAEALVAWANMELVLTRSAQAVARVQQLLPTLEAGPLRTRALLVVALDALWAGRMADAQAACEDGLRGAGAHAAERLRCHEHLATVAFRRGQADAALTHVRECLALSRALGQRRIEVSAHTRLGVLLCMSGQLAAGREAFEAAWGLAEQAFLVDEQREVACNLAKLHLMDGNGLEALQVLRSAWDLSTSFAQPTLRHALLGMQLQSHAMLGDIGAALRLSRQYLDDTRSVGEPSQWLNAVLTGMELLAAVGDTEAARALPQQLSGATEMEYLNAKVQLATAWLECRSRRWPAARAALDQVPAADGLADVEDRAERSLVQAALDLADGDGHAAGAALEALRNGLPTPALTARWWIVRLQAHAAAESPDAAGHADWAAAREAAADRRVPALDALDLMHTLLQTAPDAACAASVRSPLEALTARLAASLSDFPACAEHLHARLHAAGATAPR